MTQTQKTPTSAIDTVRELHARFSRGDLDGCLPLVADDIEVLMVPLDQTFRGKEQFMQFMQFFYTAFPDIELRHTNVVADGDQVSVEFVWNGTHLGPLMTPAGQVSATGKRVQQARVAEVFRVRDGKVARISNYQDLTSWMRPLGRA